MLASQNKLTKKEQAEGWQLLFDGETLEGWHTYLKDNADGWQVTNGILSTEGGKGDLLTDQEFENFELFLEWKVEPKGNSGIMYNVVEDKKYQAPYETGPEFQLIDDVNYPAQLTPDQKSGANYALDAPKVLAAKPAGEFNTTRIVVNDGKVEHWLNGQLVVAYELWTPEWKAKVAQTKFAEMPGYGKARKGRIALQDHGDAVAFRNIKIRKL